MRGCVCVCVCPMINPTKVRTVQDKLHNNSYQSLWVSGCTAAKQTLTSQSQVRQLEIVHKLTLRRSTTSNS